MSGIGRTLAIGSLFVVAAAGVAGAQSVTVIKATAGSTYELTMNGAALGSVKVDDTGIATIPVNLESRGGKQQTDVRVAVDSCGNLVRVQLTEPGQQPPAAEPECQRAEIAGTYVMRRESTFVVDLSSAMPLVWLRQGSAPDTWLHPELVPEGHQWAPMPTGMVLGAGGGMNWYGSVVETACGDAGVCDGRNLHWAFNTAATFWFTRSLGAEVSWVQPRDNETSGGGSGYSFVSTLQTRFIMVVGKIGVSAGPARIYGMGGGAYHRAVWNTLSIINPSTVTDAGGATIVIPGGTQTTGLESRKWDWVAGGGIEIWVKGPLAIYVEGGYAPLKGPNLDGGEARFNDHMMWTIGGLRYHLFGR